VQAAQELLQLLAVLLFITQVAVEVTLIPQEHLVESAVAETAAASLVVLEAELVTQPLIAEAEAVVETEADIQPQVVQVL
jgi:uncharacterized MnhB-related membrane protein